MTEQNQNPSLNNDAQEKVEKAVVDTSDWFKRNQTNILAAALFIVSLKNRSLRRQNIKLRAQVIELKTLVDVSTDLIELVVDQKR